MTMNRASQSRRSTRALAAAVVAGQLERGSVLSPGQCVHIALLSVGEALPPDLLTAKPEN